MLKVLFKSLVLLAIFIFSDIAMASCFPLSPADSSFFKPDQYRSIANIHAFGQYDNVCSRFNFSKSPQIVNFDFGLPSRLNSFYPLSHANELKDSLKAVSKLFFMLGSKREQILLLDHVQRLSIGSRLFVGYHNLVSEGFYKNSFARSKNFIIGADNYSRVFDCYFSLTMHKGEFNEFGGISDSANIVGMSKSELAQLSVFLSSDKRLNKESIASYRQRILVYGGNYDSSNFKLNLNSSFDIFVSKSSYTGEGSSLFYNNVFLDSSITVDTLGYKGYKASSDLSFSFNGASLFVGSRFLSVDTRIMNMRSGFMDVIPFIGSSFKHDSLSIAFEYSHVVSNSYRNNMTELSFLGSKAFNSSIVNSFILGLSSSSLPAPFLFYNYTSNHYAWENSFTTFTNFNRAFGSINILGNSVLLSANLLAFKNRYFLNEFSVPVMSNAHESTFTASVELNQDCGEFYISGIFLVNSSNSASLPVPDWQSELRLSWRHSFFNSALKAEVGMSGVYTDSWLAPAYNPALGSFYLQNNFKSEGFPVLNAFANMGISSATVFLKMERLNYGFSDIAYYLHPGYSAPPNTLKFGVLWNLKN